MRALVTGGAGFIGSHLVDALLARGHEVAIADDLSTGRRGNVDDAVAAGARLHEVDVVDAGALSAVVLEERPDVVFHLAAQIDARRSVEDPAGDVRRNVEGTVSVLETARRAGVARVVLASTGGAVYGEADTIPTAETAQARPLSPYGQAKHAAEGYCALYTALHGLSSVSLRFANVYGPRQNPLGEGGVIAIFGGRLLSGGVPVVYGDGRQTRDYVYVADAVEATLLAAGGDARGCINIGTGVETSVLELIAALQQLGGDGSFEPRFEPPRLGEVRRSCLDVRDAERLLGWRPATDLRSGLRQTLAHVAEAALPRR